MKNIISKIEPIEIKYISNAIPQLLLNGFELLKITNIEEILNSSDNAIKSKKDIEAKTIKLFKNLKKDIIKDPNKYYAIYLKNKGNILPINIFNSSSIIENLKLFISDYKKIFDNKRDFDIIIKKYGIGTKAFTLKAIGGYYNLSGERVRQIKEAEIKKIRILFDGNAIQKPYCECKKEFTYQISNFLLKINNKNIVSYKSIKVILNDKYKFQIKDEDINYLIFFMNIFGFDVIKYLDNIIYYKSNKFSSNTINQLLNTIQRTLEINVFPLDIFSIVVNVKEILNDRIVENNDIANLLEQLNEFERITKNEKDYYQLRLDFLSSAGDMGLRVLNENKKSMHFSDLVRIINQKLIQLNSNKSITADSLKVQFILSPLTIASGKTGYWSLKEWESDSNTIKSLIKSAFIYKGFPITYC